MHDFDVDLSRHPRIELVREGAVRFVSYPCQQKQVDCLLKTAKTEGCTVNVTYKGGNRQPLTAKQREGNRKLFRLPSKGVAPAPGVPRQGPLTIPVPELR